MKLLNKLFGTGLLAFILMLAVPQHTKAQDEGEISFQTFYDDLSPYGTWVEDQQYGDVWVPDAGPDFRPYATNGHWAMTDYGNTWVSDYEWGWAPFHYGRWRLDDYYGWEWIPDYEWGPAWVDWRSGGDYYGWAPLGPGVSLDVAIGGGYNVPDDYWVFAPSAYINSPVIYNYYVPRTRVVNIIHRTTYIRNTYANHNRKYIFGPRPNEIERFTHKPVNVYHINNASRPGTVRIQNNQVNIYRPRVQKAPDARPSRVVDAAAYRAANPTQRIAGRTAAGPRINHENAQRLANFSRTATPDNKIVHENNRGNRTAGGNAPGNNNRPTVENPNRPVRTDAPPRTNANPAPANRPAQPNQNREQQLQQREQQRQQQMQQQQNQNREQQNQQRQQQMQQRQQQSQAQQQQNQQRPQQRQQQEQQNQQQMQQRQQQSQAQQQQNQQQQNQQQMQQRQQQSQAQQQQNQQRQQQMQQRQQQMQQQQNQQRQQQMQQQRQQQQQVQQQRQQQMQQQQQNQQRQERHDERPPR